MYSEEEKMRRWQEIKIRQHRLKIEADSQSTPAHIEQIMKSGFSMSDIKGLHRNYSEDAVEADEVIKSHGKGHNTKSLPARPPRKGSLSRALPHYDDNSKSCFRDVENSGFDFSHFSIPLTFSDFQSCRDFIS